MRIRPTPSIIFSPLMKMLCKYKYYFGRPGKGIHSYRLFNLAIVDVLETIGMAMLLSYFTQLHLGYCLIILFLSGIILHRLFCVRSTIDKLLFH